MPTKPAASSTAKPLAEFDRISKAVHLYKPKTRGVATHHSNGGSIARQPRLVVVGSWMEARDMHIAKYIAPLQSMYPNSPILLIRSFAYHFTGGLLKLDAEIQPAVPVMHAIMDDQGNAEDTPAIDQTPQILFHLFSNGGSFMMGRLHNLYCESHSGKSQTRIPPHVTVFDSAPGLYHFKRALAAFTIGLKPWTAMWVLVGTWMSLINIAYWLSYIPWGRETAFEATRKVENDRHGLNVGEIRRAYIYSKEDELVDWRDVEAHGVEAKQKGFEMTLEMFPKSDHVAHMRSDPERYWRIVKDTWEGR